MTDTGAGTPLTAKERPVTHGRHCPCSSCAREDWTNPRLAACGMHGPSCPAVYAPALPASRPATDPAGLDVQWPDENGLTLAAERIAAEYARLSVADGPARE